MMKLIKLEWMKNNTRKYMIKAALVTAIICAFVLALAFLGIADDPDGQPRPGERLPPHKLFT